MAMVFRCDACGKICDNPNDMVRLKLFEMPGAGERRVGRRLDEKGLELHAPYEICDVCTNMLAQLLHAEKIDE